MTSLNTAAADPSRESGATLEQRIAALLGRMSLAERNGQMNQLNAEDAAAGVNWTFAPGRAGRHRRVRQALRGLRCYGAAESGRDYATTKLPENELRNVYLPPFRAAVDAGVVTLMTSFNELDGVPATANAFLRRQVLRREWGFRGFVVSDWNSIQQLAAHGLTAGDADSAYEAATAGVDMDMARLPVTFPRAVGQVPVCYGQKHGGKPPSPETAVLIDDIPVRAPQTSIGNTSYHLDAGYRPLLPFGYGLTYAGFEHSNLRPLPAELRSGEAMAVSVGNEALVDWTDRLVPVDRVIAYVRRVRAAVRQPVTVADSYPWWMHHGSRLAAEVDFIGAHTYPIFEGQKADTALAFLAKGIDQTRAALPGRPLVVLEAGWPTTSSEFPDQASEANQRRHYRELREWAVASGTTVFFFEAFDEPWKGNPGDPLTAEKHFGLYYVDRAPKEAMRK